MRYLIILRGIPGSGKSTFIRENKLEAYTLSPDNIRLQVQGPVMDLEGGLTISQSNDRLVWEKLTELLEYRMGRGELVVVDATHTTTKSFGMYKKLKEKYRYRVYVVDFSDVDLDICKARNKNRVEYKVVPEQVLENMFTNLQTQKPPAFITVIKPQDFAQTISYKVPDYSNYKKIHHIGDLQGCLSPLLKYFENDPINDTDLYIFVGDYVDRGKENHLVVEYLLELSKRENVLFLEGNHEEYLLQWANDQDIRAQEFKLRTMPQLENHGISKKAVRMWLEHLRQVVLYTFGDKTILVNHGGLSNLPENLLYTSTRQLIRGVGVYDDVGMVDDNFVKNTAQKVYQIHGHRNAQEYPIKYNERTYNLEGKVEFGGDLRIVTLDSEGFKTVEISNKNSDFSGVENDQEFEDNIEFLNSLRANKFILEKSYDYNISSFNFSRQAFYDKVWNEQTVKARGLFLNTQTKEIVIRSYDKFFNLNERPETSLNILEKNLKFPLQVWLKENGYLGLVGYNSQYDSLVFASKSSTNSDFAGWLENLFYQKVGESNLGEIKDFLKKSKSSLVFEVLEPVSDPHIIEYSEPELVLLDIISREIEFKAENAEARENFAKKYHLKTKKKALEIANFAEFLNWYNQTQSMDFQFENQHVEGFVIEDDLGFQFKIKLPYYSFWKQMRSMQENLVKNKPVSDFDRYIDPVLAEKFYQFLQTLHATELANTSIIELRKRFYISN